MEKWADAVQCEQGCPHQRFRGRLATEPLEGQVSDAPTARLLERAITRGGLLAPSDVRTLQRVLGNRLTEQVIRAQSSTRALLRKRKSMERDRAPHVQRLNVLGNAELVDDPWCKWSVTGTEKDSADATRHGIEVRIQFDPTSQAPNGDFNLIQTVNLTNTDKSYLAFGAHARDVLRTEKDTERDVKKGWVVDIPHEHRVGKKMVSPFYSAHDEGGGGQSGSKFGPVSQPAILLDFPSASAPMRFDFETAAKPEDDPLGQTLGALRWWFDIGRRAGGKLEVRNDGAKVHQESSQSHKAAVTKHLEHYR